MHIPYLHMSSANLVNNSQISVTDYEDAHPQAMQCICHVKDASVCTDRKIECSTSISVL